MLQFANAEDDRRKVVSALTQVEARSGICRLRKEKLITLAEASFALDTLAVDLRRIIEQPISLSVLQASGTMVERHYLRAMDAVQLGCAVVARDLLTAPEMRIIAADKELLAAAKKEGFDVWNPCD